jgi:Protein of unknown function (DUF4054)
MTPTTAQFRIDFPEFANTTTYPDALLTTWITVAIAQLQNAARWGTLLITGIELCAAHWIVVGQRDIAVNAVPGAVVGLQTSKGTADLSVSYDYSRTTIETAGFWNLSTYGQRFYMLSRMMGAGGIQLGGCCY